MRILIAAFGAFEEWDWRNPEKQGIGGSETAQIEMARRLAKRGHDVISFAPIPEDGTDDPNEGAPVRWRHTKDINLSEPGHWIIFRHPAAADDISDELRIRASQTFTLICEDVVYFDPDGSPAFTPERCAKFNTIVALCPTHAQYLAQAFPFLIDKLCISSNGIEVDRIEQRFNLDILDAYDKKEWITQEDAKPVRSFVPGRWNCDRNPNRIIWASSPDRGLEALLQIFKRAQEFEPALELHAFYGFDNWDKVIGSAQVRSGHCLAEKTRAHRAREAYFPETGKDAGEVPAGMSLADFSIATGARLSYKHPLEYGRLSGIQEGMKKRITDLIESTPNVFWHGRINQPRLWEEFAKSGLWVYPTTFEETSCCTCMLAQALGAIPITNNYWAVGHNVQYGHFVDGDPLRDPMTRARYVQAILHYVRQPELAEAVRRDMIPWARGHFDWERFVDQIEGWISGKPHNVRRAEPESAEEPAMAIERSAQ